MQGVDAQWVLNVVMGILVSGLAWWNGTMWGEIKDLRRQHADHTGEVNKLQVLVVGNYVTREELRDSMREMTQTVTNRIDRMADKMDSQLGDIYDELKNKVDK